jgi:phosphotransferase system enzyme I (PtsI)
MIFPGRSASPGIAIGKAVVLRDLHVDTTKRMIQDVDGEINRLRSSIKKSHTDLTNIYNHALKTLGPEEAQIFDAHIMLLNDPELISQTENMIKNMRCNAEHAFNHVSQNFISMFEAMDDEYMRARASDVTDISKRVLTYLSGRTPVAFNCFTEDVVLVADDLAPSVLASMDLSRVRGFITEKGGRTSHVAIMARTLEIPAVVGAKDVTTKIRNGDNIVFDGDLGEVYQNPADDIFDKFSALKKEFDKKRGELQSLKGLESKTVDGRKVTLAANIGSPADIHIMHANDAEGVGLFRTEFLYMNRSHFPSEEEQYKAYREVLAASPKHTVVIRTLDIGGDKKLPYWPMDHEENPFLGNRAIRLCFQHKDIFKTQLRALLRASPFGKLAIMFPMICSLNELLEAKSILKEVESQLIKEGQDISKDISVGIMIEIPSAALIADTLAKHCDFFSIGTNDLIQYTCAVDRMNKNLESLYTPYHPAVLRLIKFVIDQGHKNNIWVGVCGEVGGKADLVPLLIGMGLDEFSMSPPSILTIRKLVRQLDYKELSQKVEAILELPTAEAVELEVKKLFGIE